MATKDIDSCRVALARVFQGLPVEDQGKLVAEWLQVAFAWDEERRGAELWARAFYGLKALKRKDGQPIPNWQD